MVHFFTCGTEGLEWVISEVPCVHLPYMIIFSLLVILFEWFKTTASTNLESIMAWSLRLVGYVVVKFQCIDKSICNCHLALFKMQPFISMEWYRALFIGKQSKNEWFREREALGKINKVKEKYKGDLQNWPKSKIKLLLGFKLIFTSCLEKHFPTWRKQCLEGYKFVRCL